MRSNSTRSFRKASRRPSAAELGLCQAHNRATDGLIAELNKKRKDAACHPAMAAGVSDKLWEVGGIVKALED